MMEKQMEMFEDGGLKDEGGMIDKESGNEVPSGSTRKEVRDDIPAQLSEGEFVFPADVVRYVGLEKLMKLRQQAKMGLQRMEDMGQMGNSDEATIPDDLPFTEADLVIVDGGKEVEMAEGGVIKAKDGKAILSFDELMGDTKISFKTYKNKDGIAITIRFVGKNALDRIPEGFYPVDDSGEIIIDDSTEEETETETESNATDFMETPEYGGELDELGMVPDSVGSSASLADARNDYIEKTLSGNLSTMDKLAKKYPLFKGLVYADKLAYEKMTGKKNTTQYSRYVDRLRDDVIKMDKNNSRYQENRNLLDKVDALADKKQREINAKDKTIGGPDGNVTSGGVTSGVGTGTTGVGLAGEGSDSDFDDGGNSGGNTGGSNTGNTNDDYADQYSGPFNKGGLAAKKSKKKPTRKMKKGGLAASKK